MSQDRCSEFDLVFPMATNRKMIRMCGLSYDVLANLDLHLDSDHRKGLVSISYKQYIKDRIWNSYRITFISVEIKIRVFIYESKRIGPDCRPGSRTKYVASARCKGYQASCKNHWNLKI